MKAVLQLREIGGWVCGPLDLDYTHSACRPGLPVLVQGGDILDGACFRGIDAMIYTDDPDLVCAALGVPPGEPGVEKCVTLTVGAAD